MKFTTVLFVLCLGLVACEVSEKSDQAAMEVSNISKDSVQSISPLSYDSVYAEKVGADDYGMKSYVIAFLKRGPNRPEDKQLIDSLQSAHMANIGKLANEGKLVLAGPFYGDGDLRGIYIFDTDSIEEAASWTATDPAIIYGSLEMELIQWYGSAALMDVNELHQKAAKINF
ncbi:MAG: hypothetical protein H6600_08115 [Flavobacteriales bacterium]|nr:hypothetical protein [Flavobacteriales bacterium]MCB9198408.1 hypothetical protein [Flavobacteriales bacterium]